MVADTDHLPVETLHGVVDLCNRYARDLRNFAGFPIAVLHGPDDLGQLGISARLLNEPRQNAIIALRLFLLKQRCFRRERWLGEPCRVGLACLRTRFPCRSRLAAAPGHPGQQRVLFPCSQMIEQAIDYIHQVPL